MNRQDAAKIRAQEQGKVDPMFFKNLGQKGGKVTGVKKGFATLTPAERRAIGLKGAAARKAQREQAN